MDIRMIADKRIARMMPRARNAELYLVVVGRKPG